MKNTNRAHPIMLQATMSSAGKSLLCAGLCRLLREEGYRVAPFKSQNMALNSYITRDGLEMGRAQAVQARAAGLEPDVRMNPILLKPTSDQGSQVIVNGRVRGNYRASEYYAFKHTLLPDIQSAYEALAAEYDVVVLEGAGSPAEINLKQGDFVNMGMAKLARAPVLLIGDIDRGGVFAQLYGTLALLEEDERQLVKGTIINKFRGELALLESGLQQLQSLTHKPVAGVVPWLDVDLEDEDSLSQRFSARTRAAVLDIAVIRLPRISNFTDFAPLEATDGVGVRYITRPAELGTPDLVILPGTKSTLSDLRWLRTQGLASAICKLAARNIPVLGICGGYQMLGRRITDAVGAEGGGTLDGLGLLPVETVFSIEKRQTQVTGRVLPWDTPVQGYEIHMGRTTVDPAAPPFVRLSGGREDGCIQGSVMGSYLHGFFDEAESRTALLTALCEKKGVSLEAPALDWEDYQETQYKKLAQALRESLDLTLIHRILEEGV